nr:hypothetical protein [uncultured Bdellovibrio sp.]
MSKPKVDPRILAIAKKITAKRPKVVVDHIIENGFVTTEELEKLYGYKHPPRAARDVREQGLPLETFRVKAKDGRSIGAYRFADPNKISSNKIGGRQVFSKEFKIQLLTLHGEKCSLCQTSYEPRYLQIDHRVPYEVAGETSATEDNIEAFMLVCGTCNRKKSWSCERCVNWSTDKAPNVCKKCYWANPGDYEHIANRAINRAEVVFEEAETELFNLLKSDSARLGKSIGEYIKLKLNSKIK